MFCSHPTNTLTSTPPLSLLTMSAIARVPVAAKTVLGNVSQLKAQSKAPVVRAQPSGHRFNPPDQASAR